MTTYVLRRLLVSIPVIVGLSMLIFALVHLLPGDAVDMMLAEYGADAERLADLRDKLGLDDPLPVQYWRWAKNAVQGDFGTSLFSQRPVLEQILQQIPGTIELAIASTLISTILGIVLGVIAALYANTWIDVLTRLIALFGISMPVFWLGLISIFIFSLKLGWFPPAGTGGLKYLLLPALVVGFHSASTLARMTRASMLEVLREDYITTARAKGLREQVVVLRHALKNTLIPVVTIIGMQFSYNLGGMMVTETVFARKGLGMLTIQGILEHDIPVVQGTVLFVAIIFVVMNLIVDVSYAALDPRVRRAGK